MNNAKKINIHVSSLVGLKAELLRKQAEVQSTKEKQNNATLFSKPKLKNKSKKLKAKQENGNHESDKVTELEDVNTLRKSKYMLEAKSRLYNKLKNHQVDDDNQLYLVDFGSKSDSSDDEIYREEDYNDQNSDPEEDWVEYKDFFGRSRKCLRKDLPKMKEKDELVKKEILNEPKVDDKSDIPPQTNFVVPEKEPEIEIMRKKWEEQTEKLSFKSNIHYQDILFDEARTHGVGYYGFSQDEEERLKQQANLAKLRKETEEKQKELREIKELKNKIEENRLKAARVRQRIRAGLPAEPDPEESDKAPSGQEEKVETADEVLEDKQLELKKPEDASKEDSLAEIEDKIKAFGELLGKRPKWRELSQEEWIHKRRKDRLGEFAPSYDNFQRGGTLMSNRNNKMILKEGNGDPLKIHCQGPEPTDLWESNNFRSGEDDICERPTDGDSSDESDIIGPMPPSDSLSQIPLPTDEPQNSAWNDENVLAGLKYLREKFDEKNSS